MNCKVNGMFVFWSIFSLTVFGDSSGHDDSGEMSVPRRPRISGPETVQLTYFFGDELEDLVCLIEGSPTPSVIWLRDGKRVTKDDFDTEFDGKEGKATLEFKMESASLKSQGNYSCIAGNFLGRASKTIRISVVHPEPTSTSTSGTTNPSSSTSSNNRNTLINSRENQILK